MKILVLGNDGYIGYPLTLHLLKKGHEVFGIDNYSRRQRVDTIGSNSLTPIRSYISRKSLLRSYPNFIDQVDLTFGFSSYSFIKSILHSFQPNAIVHLAEMPSAPWSMIDAEHADTTQFENVIGTLHLLWAMKEECPEAHLVKLGTMGEYGTPNCDIPEGMVPENCLDGIGYKLSNTQSGSVKVKCPMSNLLFPRQPGSFYHLSKVHDTYNIDFACRNWRLRSTDIMQGVVFGLLGEGDEITRFDYDEYFGTAINRFCAQVIIEHPLTVYGKGDQTRGFLPLKDSIQCLTIVIENPPKVGEYRTLNQFENIYSINELANMVLIEAIGFGLDVEIDHIPNPRKEAEQHYYNPTHQGLLDLGYKPTTDIQSEITKLIRQLLPYSDRVIKKVIMPKINWR